MGQATRHLLTGDPTQDTLQLVSTHHRLVELPHTRFRLEELSHTRLRLGELSNTRLLLDTLLPGLRLLALLHLLVMW